MIAVVVAMEKEAKDFLNIINIKEEKEIAGKRIVVGNLMGKDLVVGVAGIGKVNVALTTQLIIDNFNPSCVVNFGLAGGKGENDFKVGDIVLVEKACQYDFDLSELDDVEIGYMQDYDTVYYPLDVETLKDFNYPLVKCATADRFTNKEYFLEVIKNIGGQISDMELGAIAQVCLANKTKLISIKLISDADGEEKSIFDQYYNNLDYVSVLAEEVKKVIEKL